MPVNQRESEAPASITLPLRVAWLVLAVVVIADVMDLIDSSIANLAGPSIRADLGGGQVTVQWVLSAYTAAFALGLVTSAPGWSTPSSSSPAAIGVAALGTVFFARVGHPSLHSYFAAAELVVAIVAGLDLLTLLLVGLLPRHAQQTHG